MNSARYQTSDRVRWKVSRRTSWFWRGVFVAAVANSFLAAADLNVETQSVLSEFSDVVELYSPTQSELPGPLHEVELQPQDGSSIQKSRSIVAESNVKEDVRALVDFHVATKLPNAQVDSDATQQVAAVKPEMAASDSFRTEQIQSKISYSSDIPKSEILRVSKAFHGMVQESLRDSAGQLSRQFVGSLADTEFVSGERLAELETNLLDETTEIDDGYAVGQDVDTEVELSGLDPFKTYTVVNGRVHAVTPKQSPSAANVAASGAVTATEKVLDVQKSQVGMSAGALPQASLTQKNQNVLVVAQSGSAPKVIVQNTNEKMPQTSEKSFELPAEQVNQELNKLVPQSGVAALDSNPAEADRVTIRGRVQLPSGFANDRTVLRMAGTGFQVQTDAAGAFELRDVPRNTRFEFLVWHLDGGLTRRLVPVVASGREKALEIHLQKTSDVDHLANSFSIAHQMNQAGFCGRVEHETPAALAGGQVFLSSGRKTLQAHYFSANGLPSTEQSELSEDGRFCVFNVEDSLVDVKISLLNGVRRQLVVHVEPSTFEHDLIFDVSESLYRKVALLEPLDTQQVLELSAQGVQPEFGDKRLRDWLFGEDVPVWTRVSRFLMQADPAYASIRPSADDVQYFPGGQEIVEVRLSRDHPGAPLSRVLLARDQLMTSVMLKQIETLKSRIYQDRSESISVPALDADAWDDIVSQNVDVPQLQDQTVGGVYVSIDTMSLGYKSEDIVMSVRDTWSGKEVCKVVPLKGSRDIKKGRYLRAVCGASPGQYALILESREGALLWSDIVRIRPGDVQTVTVLDSKF